LRCIYKQFYQQIQFLKMALKNVIIQSIGTARPGTGKVLADVLGVSNEVVVKLLYCTPSVLFQHIDEELAANTSTLLSQLGLEVQVTNDDVPLPEPPALYDLAVFIPNPLQINTVNSQLAAFLGCTEQESLNLLLKDPALVLGGVSQATAEALSKCIDAEVIISDPKTDLYTIKVLNRDAAFLKQITAAFANAGLTVDLKKQDCIEDIDYTTSQQLWQRLGNTKSIEIYNQSFQRYDIILESADTGNTAYREVLTNEVGMPGEIIDEVLQNLPILLNDSVNRKTLQELLELYTTAGLRCSFNKIPFGDKQLVVDNISQPGQAASILNQFYTGVTISKATVKWVAPKPVSPLLSRLLTQQLQDIGCEVETKPVV
jgi:hypothetical protein